MKYTNKQGIPDELAAAISTDHYSDPNDKPSDYSVTTLISPIQQTTLMRRHENDHNFPTSDVLDNFNAWVGSVLHNAIEDAWKKGMDSVLEERYYMDIEGKILSGKIDCLQLTGKIIDWKTCKLYKVQKQDYRAWEEQANLYAMLAEANGHKVNELEVVAIILDWKKTESKYKKDYPESPIVPLQLNVWTQEERLNFAKQRVSMLNYAEKLTDKQLAELCPCTRYDQWSSFKGCALIKEGNSKATKVFESREDAEKYIQENEKYKDYILEERWTPKTRCNDYCSVRPYCYQFKKEAIAEGNNTPVTIGGKKNG